MPHSPEAVNSLGQRPWSDRLNSPEGLPNQDACVLHPPVAPHSLSHPGLETWAKSHEPQPPHAARPGPLIERLGQACARSSPLSYFGFSERSGRGAWGSKPKRLMR